MVFAQLVVVWTLPLSMSDVSVVDLRPRNQYVVINPLPCNKCIASCVNTFLNTFLANI